MRVHLEHGDIHLLDLRTRMPFKYGIATMTHTPHVFVRLWVQVDGKRTCGSAADHLPPKWFTKDPTRSIMDEVAEMARVVEHAVRIAAGIRADSPFDAWRQLWDVQSRWGHDEGLPPLLTHFGTSLAERALIEAVCRATGQTFAQMLHANQFGIRLGDIHESLKGKQPADYLMEQPLSQIIARHTVGLADPLVDADVAPAERLDDGLPQSLAACIRAYGLRHFKIKVSGQIDHDQTRVRRIAAVIEAHTPADYAFSLDGNEQFHALAEFQLFWEQLRQDANLRRFFDHLLFVEQPFHRDVALQPSVMGAMTDQPGLPPLIIDESDGELDSLPRALNLGYGGTSHKNCKGVFKGIANACLLAQRRREHPHQSAILSGEDLANIGPVALLQDLAVCAALGIASVERNGHHYFAGLSMFPQEVQEQVLETHGDLYQRSRDGWPTLRIADGQLQLGSLNRAPFGVGFALDVAPFTPLETWRKKD